MSSASSERFIKPTFVDWMLQADDADGFVDRQLFDFPPERNVYLNDLKVPIPRDVPKMVDIFKACALYMHILQAMLSI